MNREHLEDILVDLEVLYNKLPPLARAHINEAQRSVMRASQLLHTYPAISWGAMRCAGRYVAQAREALA